jgi:hypothetical protein
MENKNEKLRKTLDSTPPADDFWGEPISTYSDAEAVDDGVLVPITKKDRCTRPVFSFLAENTPMGAQPPDRWPVEMMGWFRAEAMKREEALKLIAEFGKNGAQAKFLEIIRDRKALALAKGLIGSEELTARRIYENNEGGGIHKVFVATGATGEIVGISPIEIPRDDAGNLGWKPNGSPTTTLWLLPNELGGITLLLPEDY